MFPPDCNAEITFFAGDCSKPTISPINCSFDFSLVKVSNWLSPMKIAESMYAAFKSGLSPAFLSFLISYAGAVADFEKRIVDEPFKTS